MPPHNHDGESSFAADLPPPGGSGRDVPSPCLRVSPGTVFRQRVDHPHRPAARAASSRPCLLCLTGNGIQCEQSTTPTARPLARPPPAPFQGAGSKWRLPRIPCTGRKRDFMEISVRPIRACLLQGTVSMGNRPCGEAARRGGGWNIPLPCPDVSPGTVFVEHPFPCLLRLWLNVFRLTNPRLPSMPSRKKPHHAL